MRAYLNLRVKREKYACPKGRYLTGITPIGAKSKNVADNYGLVVSYLREGGFTYYLTTFSRRRHDELVSGGSINTGILRCGSSKPTNGPKGSKKKRRVSKKK